VDLPAKATVRDALMASRFEFQEQRVGIFGQRVALDHRLSPGDRVEIYRPLEVDPKEARRRRAIRGRSPK
jgi:putative ubiquitin-RnfH superfamily antitoxin RatB of RatAB toxin-antitoxin module